MKKIKLYSDGGASPNPGVGGFGIILEFNGIKKEFYKGYKLTTNNRMELMGVIFGLEKLTEKSEVEVYSDSKYVVYGIEKGWVKGWKKKGWKKKGGAVLNIDLWSRLIKIIEKHKVKFYWIKGHNGHIENERCDELVGIARKGKLICDIDKSEKLKIKLQGGLF